MKFPTATDTKTIAYRWAGSECYLDGKLAKVCGRFNQFATVAALDGSVSVEFSWDAVNRIMYGKMEFRS